MRWGVFQRLRTRSVAGVLGVILAAVGAATLAAGAQRLSPSDVAGVRLGGDAAETRIVVDLRRATSGKVAAPDAGAIAVDLADIGAPATLQGAGRGLVSRWWVGRASGGARLTLQLAATATVERRFLLPPADGVANYRYVIDIAATKTHARRAPSLAPAAPALLQAAPAAPPPAQARKIIVLDPGHGGKDPGADGAISHEKDVTLAAARALKARLEKTGRYAVVMTRDSDAYIPLETRVQIARRAGADLFLSLHADSGPDPATHGASVYTLSDRGTARVGYVLNGREWFLQPAANGGDHAVSQILLDLSQRSTRNHSAEFALDLIQHVGARAPLLERSRRDADYFVLLAPDVPAALLEMGFITNADDEARLNDSDARAALAGEIAGAIDAYFGRATRLASR